MHRVLAFCFLLAGVCAAQDTNFSAGPQYLMNYGSPILFQPIATRTLSLDAPLPPIPATPEANAQNPPSQAEIAQDRAALKQAAEARIYWGQPAIAGTPSEIEISSAELPASLPASITDGGVAGVASAQILRERGYGQSLGEIASYWKTHKRHAPRVYTNKDLSHMN